MKLTSIDGKAIYGFRFASLDSPLPGMIAYFAYGSNTHLPSLSRYLIEHGIDPAGITNPRRAILEHYCLRTNYVMSTCVGATNIEQATHDRVEGLLMEISPTVHHVLRRKEGFPHRYREINVCLHLPRSRQLILAMTYVVSDEYRLTTDMPVHPTYREIVLDGARQAGFTKKYQHYLSRLLRTA